MTINAARKELATQDQTFTFSPKTLEEAQKYAMIIANSGICPQSLKGRPNDILVILQLGHELKLKPMQALRSLGCINGMPFAWGDGQLALVKNHPDFVDIKEWLEGVGDSLTAYCTITRKNQAPQTRSFSKADALLAGLWNKNVWKQYPKRMLQHRARGFACRDVFPDALMGLMSEEEVKTIIEEQETPTPVIKGKGLQGLEDALDITEPNIVEGEVIEIETNIEPEEILTEIVQEEPIEYLKKLIKKKNVDGKTVNTWLKKINISRLEDMDLEQINTCIEFLTKE